MRLLSPKETSTQSQKKDSEATERIAKMREAEAEAARRVSTARDTEKAELERISREIEEAEAIAKEQKETLRKEIESLEATRKEALKPIKEIRLAAERELKDAKRMTGVLEKRLAAMQKDQEELVRRTENVTDRESACKYWEEDLVKRDIKKGGEEKRLQKSQAELSKKWLDFHTTVHAANEDMKKREAVVSADAKANQSFAQTLREEKQLNEKDRTAIKDGYANLARARKEILGRDT